MKASGSQESRHSAGYLEKSTTWGGERSCALSLRYTDMTSVWLTPEIAHFAVSKYFSRSYASWSSPELLCSPVLCHAHLCSATLTCTLPCSLVLYHAPSCSAVLPHALPCSLMLCHTPLHSATLPHALLCSLVLCHTPSHSAACLWATFLHFSPCPPGLPYTPCTTCLLSYHLYSCSWTLRTLSI
jgi:hypothetical protein